MRFKAQIKTTYGEWLQALLVDQAERAGAALVEVAEPVWKAVADGYFPAAVMSPRPVRGYGIVTKDGTTYVHVLEDQPDAAYKALFSTMIGNARQRGLRDLKVVPEVTAGYVGEKIEALGKPYGVTIENVPEAEISAPMEDEDLDEDEGMEEVEESPDEFECEECGRSFTTSRGLAMHRRVHL